MDNNNMIKGFADTIYRGCDKLEQLLERKYAGEDALNDIYGGRGAGILEIEMEKAGNIKTLADRINVKLDVLNTHIIELCKEMGVDYPYREFTTKDLDPAAIEKAKDDKALGSAVKALEKSVAKVFETKLKDVFGVALSKKLIASIKKVYAISDKIGYNPVNIGSLKRKKTSDFVD